MSSNTLGYARWLLVGGLGLFTGPYALDAANGSEGVAVRRDRVRMTSLPLTVSRRIASTSEIVDDSKGDKGAVPSAVVSAMSPVFPTAAHRALRPFSIRHQAGVPIILMAPKQSPPGSFFGV